MSRARLARGVGFNLVGALVPAALGLLSLPVIAAGLGSARLGLLSLAWAALGYLGVLNLGVGRALAREAAGSGGGEAVARVAWTGIWLTLALGTTAGAILYPAAPALAAGLRLDGLRAEAVDVFRLVAAALPWTVAAPSLVGLLEARGRFGRLNAVSAAVSAVSYLGPVAVLWAGGGLIATMQVLVAARVAGWIAYAALCLEALPALRRVRGVDRAAAGEILRFGGWSTVSTVASPLMTYMDRFAVAGIVSAAAVAFYAAPQEVVTRLGSVSGAVVSVLFPAFAAAAPGQARDRLASRGVWAVGVLVVPLSLVLAAFAGPALGAWLGEEYAARGASALGWLALGLLWNGLAKVPSALLQAAGRPDLTARIHLAELPVYLPLLLAAVAWRGVEGAAVVYALRAGADAVAHYGVAVRLAPETRPSAVAAAWLAGAATLGVGVAVLLPPAGWRPAWVAALLLGFGLAALRSASGAGRTPAALGRQT